MANHDHEHMRSSTKKLRIAFFLNFIFTIVEVVGGIWTHSLAILSDAIHDLGDTLGLALAWYLERFSKKDPDRRFTFGYRRFSVLGAIINSTILVVGTVLIIREAIPRIIHPKLAHADGMIWFAIAGIIFNSIGAFVVRDKDSLNVRVIYLHLLEDVLGWIVVLIGAVIMKYTEWIWLDPVMSIMISVYIAYRAFGNLKGGIRIVMQGAPDDLQYSNIKKAILGVPDVLDTHDLRIWSLDGERIILSTHIVVGEQIDYGQMARIKEQIHTMLSKMGIAHSTLEVEMAGECNDRETGIDSQSDEDIAI